VVHKVYSIPLILVNVYQKLKESYTFATLLNCGKTLTSHKMETRTCTKCGEAKSANMFSKRLDSGNYRSDCKACRSKIECERRRNNSEEFKAKDAIYYSSNKEMILEKNREYRKEHRNEIMKQKQEYYVANKDRILEYHQNNKEVRNTKRAIRLKNDAQFKITERLKSKVSTLVKSKNDTDYNDIIRCSTIHFKEWLEYQFDDGMTFENYGTEWHIDHVIPISFFDFTMQKVCFDWTNTRPLYAKENMKKSKRIIQADIIRHIDVLKKFPGYQTDYENSWWRRLELLYGNNPVDDVEFRDLLQRAIRIQYPFAN